MASYWPLAEQARYIFGIWKRRSLWVNLLGHKGMIFELAFDFLSERLASVGRDGSARVYDVATLSEVHAFTGFGDLRQVTFSPDGRYLAFSNFGNGVMIGIDLTPPPSLRAIRTEFRTSPSLHSVLKGAAQLSVLLMEVL